jgi:hypothetical protein
LGDKSAPGKLAFHMKVQIGGACPPGSIFTSE